jgi:hypothetical protein
MGLSLLFKMFPLYYFLKSALLVFLMAPAFQGASWIYNAIINLGFPVLKKHIASHFHPEEKRRNPMRLLPQSLIHPKHNPFSMSLT